MTVLNLKKNRPINFFGRSRGSRMAKFQQFSERGSRMTVYKPRPKIARYFLEVVREWFKPRPKN